MKAMENKDFAAMYQAHQEWLESAGSQGEQLDMSGEDMDGWDFAGLNLNRAIFSYASLKGANFEDTWGPKIDFHHSALDGANLTGAQMRGADFDHAILYGADLSLADITGATALWADCQNATWTGACVSKVNFDSAKLNYGKGNDMCAVATCFRRCNMEGFYGPHLKAAGADFTYAALGGANFKESNFACAEFSGCDIPGTDLTACDLRYSVLGPRDCELAVLVGADARGAYPISPNLEMADMTGVIFSEREQDEYGRKLTELAYNIAGEHLPWERGGWPDDVSFPPDTPYERISDLMQEVFELCKGFNGSLMCLSASKDPRVGADVNIEITENELLDLEGYLYSCEAPKSLGWGAICGAEGLPAVLNICVEEFVEYCEGKAGESEQFVPARPQQQTVKAAVMAARREDALTLRSTPTVGDKTR